MTDHTVDEALPTEPPGRHFYHFLDQLPALHYVIDMATGRLAHVAGEVEELIGSDRDDLVSGEIGLEQFVHPEDRAFVIHAARGGTPDDPPESARYRILHRDGSSRWVQDRRRVVRGENGLVLVGVVTDITAHRAADVAELAERERVAQGERAIALTRLAGGIAHQFNNLLTTISGYAALAHESLAAGDPAREMLAEALAAAGRAREVAASLLAFAGGVVLRSTDGDLNAIVGSALSRAWPTADRAGIDVVFAPEPLAIHADPARLEDAITGLLVAVRGLEAAAPLRVETMAAGDLAVVEIVEPTGRLGDDPGTLVTPFRRTPERVAVDDLAFAAADGIARGSGGRLEIHARADGTVVRFAVPRIGAPAVGVASREAALAYVALSGAMGARVVGGRPAGPRAAGRPDGRGRIVLVVDDDDGVRTFMEALVARSGLTPVSAGSAAGALEILASDRRIDAIVADVVMPGISGLELAALAGEMRPGLAMLFVSGDPGKHPPDQIGDRPFLAKPFGPAAFREALQAVLGDAPPAG